LEQQYPVRVEREIDVMLLGRFYHKGRRGGYTLSLQMPCDSLLTLSSLKMNTIGNKIVKELYFDILNADNKFKSISVLFVCDTSDSKYQIKFYDCLTDTLK